MENLCWRSSSDQSLSCFWRLFIENINTTLSASAKIVKRIFHIIENKGKGISTSTIKQDASIYVQCHTQKSLKETKTIQRAQNLRAYAASLCHTRHKHLQSFSSDTPAKETTTTKKKRR